MIKELANSYNHEDLEEEIYHFWEESGYFRPEKVVELGFVKKNEKSQFCITIPLPNVTGQLHLGHALTISLEDLMTRYERMNHRQALFIPGTDHAGIATQNVVEREILKQGVTKKELGREKFVEKIWEWKKKYHARITEQSKRMGMSSDWSRERFTLDDVCTKAVREAFYRLYQKGLIFRGEYMVNWCPRCETAISDLETVPVDTQSSLWYIRYPIKSKKWKKPAGEWGSGNWAKNAKEFIIVATTRPETLLGDTAVATRDDHSEYSKFIGKRAILPVNNREIPVIVDDYVDPEFGSGALKITPGHDPNDFEIGQRHKLEVITVLDEKANILPEHSGKYTGMGRLEARDAIVEDLKKEGLLVEIEPYTHPEPHCQRCHTLIEPRVSIQWFVKTKPLAEAAMEKVRSGETIIMPERERKRFFQWMENIHDWCISRQLWWGHRIPIWYCSECSEEICPLPDVNEIKKCPKCGSDHVSQDEDVLDTWFSSALWPFSTLKWPDEKHSDFQNFYPTTTRETGYDILFFWVAREMMLGVELTGKAPYKNVYLHGIIRDDKGRKISKSMEDVERYDPLLIIEDYGADALRWLLISNTLPGIDMNLDLRQLTAAHRFFNKIWQSARFTLYHIQESEKLPKLDSIKKDLQLPDQWILSRLNKLVESVDNSMQTFDYLEAARKIKSFYWYEFCDWYLEMSKIRLYKTAEKVQIIPKVVLLHVIDTCLRLLHPIIPFMTEKLWLSIPFSSKLSPALIVAEWPKSNHSFINSESEKKMEFTFDLVCEIRRIRSEFGVGLAVKVPLHISLGNEENSSIFESTMKEIISLAKIDSNKLIVSTTDDLERPEIAAKIVLPGIEAFIPLETIIDLGKERDRINGQLNKVNKEINQIATRLNSSFAQRAPLEIVEKAREDLNELESKKHHLTEQLKILK